MSHTVRPSPPTDAAAPKGVHCIQQEEVGENAASERNQELFHNILQTGAAIHRTQIGNTISICMLQHGTRMFLSHCEMAHIVQWPRVTSQALWTHLEG